MNGPYFHKQSWTPFVHSGQLYDLTHLDEYQIVMTDSTKTERRIAVTFSDHCFTRNAEPGDGPDFFYPASDRNPGVFCPDRYEQSLQVKEFIAQAVTGRVWHLGREGYAIVPSVDHMGARYLYGIIFSLDPVSGLPVDLRMRVRSAHVRDERVLVTYGAIKFAHLVTLRVAGKHPKPIMDRHRTRPKVT